MEIKTCLLRQNPCYAAQQKMIPSGIVVHSTGANNTALCRYVQPDMTDPDRIAILADIGKNRYNNDWNRPGKQACVHAFIGKNASGVVEVYQTLPWNICAWGVGNGKKGSYNFSPAYLQFEICEDGLKDRAYFSVVMDHAIDLCVYLAELFRIPTEKVISHHEAYLQGYGCNHADIDHWLKKQGTTMAWFREQVDARRNHKYRVWSYEENTRDKADEQARLLRKAGFPAFIEERKE